MSRSESSGHTPLGQPMPVMPAVNRPIDGAPNVVLIVLDDLGFAELGCFGSDMETPHLDRLARGGLRYNRFHVTALCSPTRACLLTGRNHHAVGVGFLVDTPLTYPGYDGRIPKSAGTLPRLLRDAGYSTMAVGKWHLVPRGERSHSGPFDRWPSGFGFEKYYGFLQGDTNQWTPNLVRDHHYVDPPHSSADGYHLTEDLADTAIRYILDQQQATPGKPFFLYFATGATHAPHHVPRSWVERYAGRFDDGWDQWRHRAFARQRAEGIVPDTAVLTDRPSWVPAWDDLDGGARRLFARMRENYAGFLSHTDAQIGRVVAFLDELGQLDNTLIVAISDNGASAEGGVIGTFNEHRFTQRTVETVEGNLAHADDWGGFRTYPHYAWGWAWAGNTPFRRWKRYAWLGGTRVPLIMHWPRRVTAGGEVRGQLCHVVDLMPTILDACGVAAPELLDGVTQQPVDGAPLQATFDDPAAPSPRHVQYFEMLGSRAIVAGEWKATTDHVSQGVLDEENLLEGSRSFADDRWSLFYLEQDFSEATDVAEAHPDVLRQLQELWFAEAGHHGVLPISDSLTDRLGASIGLAYPPAPRSVFRPGASPVTDESVPNLAAGGRITAVVDVPDEGAQGVLCAMGDWTSGFALYMIDGRLSFTVNTGVEAVTVVADEELGPGRHQLRCTLTAHRDQGVTIELSHDDRLVGTGHGPQRLPFTWQHGGTALCVGYDRGFPVCDDYNCPFPWTGTLHQVIVEVAEHARPDPTEELRTALHHE